MLYMLDNFILPSMIYQAYQKKKNLSSKISLIEDVPILA